MAVIHSYNENLFQTCSYLSIFLLTMISRYLPHALRFFTRPNAFWQAAIAYDVKRILLWWLILKGIDNKQISIIQPTDFCAVVTGIYLQATWQDQQPIAEDDVVTALPYFPEWQNHPPRIPQTLSTFYLDKLNYVGDIYFFISTLQASLVTRFPSLVFSNHLTYYITFLCHLTAAILHYRQPQVPSELTAYHKRHCFSTAAVMMLAIVMLYSQNQSNAYDHYYRGLLSFGVIFNVVNYNSLGVLFSR